MLEMRHQTRLQMPRVSLRRTLAFLALSLGALAGPALAKIYFGFTTGRSASASDNETIIVKNLILRAQ